MIDNLAARLARLGADPGPDALFALFTDWCTERGLQLYPHQEEAVVDLLSGAHTIVATPTGSGKSLIAVAAHLSALAAGGRSYYTAPIKALVSEKFFALCRVFDAANVGMVTGDAAVNPDAPIICCTAEILANIALRTTPADAAQVAHTVVMDEFHFIAEPDRGWAWQTTLTELPASRMLIMSATLGDTTSLVEGIRGRSDRPVEVVTSVTRPVPLMHSWSTSPIPEELAKLLAEDKVPVYIVHTSQAAAVERAQALLTDKIVPAPDPADLADAIGHFRFSPGFGRTLEKYLKAGIGVHHAGMLPRYRRLVETLAQRGTLSVICGTDTLGVGINVPIRTVMLTQLTKFDGHRERVLRVREFHQLAGRAGRAGYDTVGYVVAQAPDWVIENARALAKAGDDPKKRRRVHKRKPPEGTISWTDKTFERLVDSPPETLVPRMRITPSMLLNLLQRDEDTIAAVRHLVDESTTDAARRRKLYLRALRLGRSMRASGVVVRLDAPTPGGREYTLSPDLQDDFALNQPLSGFALAALDLLDPDSPEFALDVISVIEATLDNPMPVLLAQQFRARGEAVAEMKADGLEYDERMAALEEVTWPKPLEELLEHAFGVYQGRHPWLSPADLNPKSVVREMVERAMTFGEYIAFHKLQRSEGLLLRYLSDAYRALRQTVPEHLRAGQLEDLVEWLGEVVRMVDSSLLDEWEALTHPEDEPAEAPAPSRTLTSNERAFTVLVRNAMFRRVQLVADEDVEALVAMDGPDATFTADDWDEALDGYYEDHGEVLLDADARGPSRMRIEKHERQRRWIVDQIVSDPDGDHDWQINAVVDLAASDEADALVLRVVRFGRVD